MFVIRGKVYSAWIASIPTVVSAGVACLTFVQTNVREQTLDDFNSRKKSIDEKLKNLYGPLYGNRLLFQRMVINHFLSNQSFFFNTFES